MAQASRTGELQLLARVDAQQREVHRHGLAIDEVVNLTCPKGHVFNQPPNWDFATECLALSCLLPGCGAHFCGWCQKDCGNGWSRKWSEVQR